MLTPSLAKPECAPQEESCVGSAAPWRLHRLKGGGLLLGSPRWLGKWAGSVGMPTPEGNLTYFQHWCSSVVTTYNHCHLGNETRSHGNLEAALLLSFKMLTVGKRPLQITPPKVLFFFSPLINLLCYLIWNSEERHMFNWRCLVEINLWKKKKSWMFY